MDFRTDEEIQKDTEQTRIALYALADIYEFGVGKYNLSHTAKQHDEAWKSLSSAKWPSTMQTEMQAVRLYSNYENLLYNKVINRFWEIHLTEMREELGRDGSTDFLDLNREYSTRVKNGEELGKNLMILIGGTHCPHFSRRLF